MSCRAEFYGKQAQKELAACRAELEQVHANTEESQGFVTAAYDALDSTLARASTLGNTLSDLNVELDEETKNRDQLSNLSWLV